jgi:hypothetical protein
MGIFDRDGTVLDCADEGVRRDPDHSMMWMSADDDYVDAWHKFSQDKSGEYSTHFITLEGNFPLYLALIFSLYWDFLAE